MGNPCEECEVRVSYEKSAIFSQVWLYHRNDTRYAHGYYGALTGSHM